MIETHRGNQDNLLFPLHNDPESATVIHGVRARLVSPDFMIAVASGAKLGPADLEQGATFTFDIPYVISSSAPYGCFRAFIKLDMEDKNVWPDPDDDATTVDYVVLPATGTPEHEIAKREAAKDCRQLLDAAEPPIRATACRHRVADLARNPPAPEELPVLLFTEADRTRRDKPVEQVIVEASSGSVPAILELGFRSDKRSLAALERLAAPPTRDELAASYGDHFWECDEKIDALEEEWGERAPVVRLALAKRGNRSERAALLRGLVAGGAEARKRTINSLVYLGDSEAERELVRQATVPDASEDLRFEFMRSFELLHPDIARRLEADGLPPDERWLRWLEWVRSARER